MGIDPDKRAATLEAVRRSWCRLASLDVMVPGSLHEAMADLLGGTDARTRPFLNDTLVRQWLSAFAAARHARQGGAISREGLYRRAFMLLSLELWLRDHRLAW